MYCTILYDVSTVCGIHKYRHMYIYTYNVCTRGVWVREREGREGRGKGKGGERGGEGRAVPTHIWQGKQEGEGQRAVTMQRFFSDLQQHCRRRNRSIM